MESAAPPYNSSCLIVTKPSSSQCEVGIRVSNIEIVMIMQEILQLKKKIDIDVDNNKDRIRSNPVCVFSNVFSIKRYEEGVGAVCERVSIR